jgi:tetratricopeptide (TPR) repeat protein
MKTQLLLLAAVLTTGASAESPTSASLATVAERAIEHAYLCADAAALAAAVKPLAAALAREPDNAALLYVRAFGYYAATAPLRATNNKEAIQAQLEQAVALLQRVKGAPWEVEAAALQGSILGQLIGLKGGLAGMTLGPKSSRLLARAAQAAPDNPRGLLFRGISLLSTPTMWGGDPVEGTKLLQQAVDRFVGDDVAAPGPHWGRADALTWLGIAKQKAGDTAGARTAWQQALAIEPDYAWVKFALLPSLGQKAPKQ